MEGRRQIIQKNKAFGIALVGVVMLFALACEGNHEFSFKSDFNHANETIEEVLNVGDAPTLVINSENGSIVIESGEANEIIVQADIRRPDDVEFDIAQDGDTITITSRAREDFFSFHGSPGAEIEVTTPSNTELDIRTSNGSIDVEGVQKSGSMRTSNGKIVLEDVKGAFETRTSNGKIEFRGELIPDSSSELRTSNGSVTVELLGSPNVRIDATTSNGTVKNNLPITISSMDNNHISGTIGDGAAKLVVRTSNGSVTIQ